MNLPSRSAAPSRMVRRGLTALAAVALAASGMAPASAETVPAPAPSVSTPSASNPDAILTPFYETPASLPSAPGMLVKSEPSAFYLGPAKLIKLGKSSTRLMYTSTNAAGATVPVTGTYIASAAAWTGPGARPLISYAPGTQGVANSCAPSYQGHEGVEYESTLISTLLSAGYDVVVTDYIGLGTQGIHTYMNRLDQGHAVLDAARAVRNAGLGGTTAQTPVGLAGYSQGGGASASAAELAPVYAPDLNVKAAYAGSVPADLKQVITQIDGSLYNAFVMYSAQGLLEADGVAPGSYLNAKGVAAYTATNAQCTLQAIPTTALVPTSTLTLSGQKLSVLAQSEPFSARLDRQKIGVGLAPKVPTLISHSVMDDVIPYQTGRDLARRWCAQGTRVSMDSTLVATHIGGYAASIPRVMIFFGRQFANQPNIDNCGTIL